MLSSSPVLIDVSHDVQIPMDVDLPIRDDPIDTDLSSLVDVNLSVEPVISNLSKRPLPSGLPFHQPIPKKPIQPNNNHKYLFPLLSKYNISITPSQRVLTFKQSKQLALALNLETLPHNNNTTELRDTYVRMITDELER